MFKEAIELTCGRKEEIGNELKQLKKKQREELREKEKELENIDHAIAGLQKVQSEYDREQGNLAVQKGICPFPDCCECREHCTLNSCNADTCTNGYAFRWS